MRGRVAQRRRWPDGLQAAVEAKEGLDATAEGEVLGTITVQAYIGALPKAVRHDRDRGATSATSCGSSSSLEVAVIPPNTPCIREDEPDRIYATRAEKDEALVDEIQRCHEAGRPVLVGTLDVKESEGLAAGAGRRRGALRGAQRQERRRGGGDHRRGRRVRRGDRLHPDGRPGRRHPARRQRPGRPGPGGRAGRALRHRQRPARQPPGRRPAARPGRPAGRPGRLGLLRQPGGRPGRPARRRRHAGLAADERRRPGHRRAGRLRGRARPAGRRGRQPRDPPQHLALQRGHRAAAQGPGRAPGAAADHRRGRADAARPDRRRRPSEMDEDLLARVGPVDRALPHRPALGRAPGRAVRGARGRAPAGAGPARPAGRVPPGGGAGVQRPRSRRSRRGPSPPSRRPSSTRTGSRTRPSWSGRAPPGRTWCTTTRSARSWTG